MTFTKNIFNIRTFINLLDSIKLHLGMDLVHSLNYAFGELFSLTFLLRHIGRSSPRRCRSTSFVLDDPCQKLRRSRSVFRSDFRERIFRFFAQFVSHGLRRRYHPWWPYPIANGRTGCLHKIDVSLVKK